MKCAGRRRGSSSLDVGPRDRQRSAIGKEWSLISTDALIAALTAGSDGAEHTQLDVLGIVWGTTVGLALVATLVVAALSEDLERLGARMTAALFIAGLVGFEARSNGLSRGRAATYGLIALTIGLAIAALKWFLSK